MDDVSESSVSSSHYTDSPEYVTDSSKKQQKNIDDDSDEDYEVEGSDEGGEEKKTLSSISDCIIYT